MWDIFFLSLSLSLLFHRKKKKDKIVIEGQKMVKFNKSLRIPKLKVPSATLPAAETWEHHSSNVILGRIKEISNAVSLTLAHVYLSEETNFVLVVYSDDQEYSSWIKGLLFMIPENNYQIIHIGSHAKNLHQSFKSSSSSSASASALADDLSDLSDINDFASFGSRVRVLCVCSRQRPGGAVPTL